MMCRRGDGLRGGRRGLVGRRRCRCLGRGGEKVGGREGALFECCEWLHCCSVVVDGDLQVVEVQEFGYFD